MPQAISHPHPIKQTSEVMKYIVLILMALVIVTPSVAQNDKQEWGVVDSLIDEQYYDNAYKLAEKKYYEAIKAHDKRQSLVAAYYLSQIGYAYREDNTDSALARYQMLLPDLDGVDRAVCQMLVASLYATYYDNNRWKIDENDETDDPDLDYGLWTPDRFRLTVGEWIKLSLSDHELLLSTPSDSLGALAWVEEGEDGMLMPTVFDVLVWRAAELAFTMGFHPLWPSDVDRPELLFAEAERFVELSVRPDEPRRNAVASIVSAMQRQEQFHLSKGSEIMIELYLFRCHFLDRFFMSARENDDMILEQLAQTVVHFRKAKAPHITLLYAELAKRLYDRQHFVEAMHAIDTALMLQPDSPGAIKCFNLKRQITRKSIDIDCYSPSTSSSYSLAVVNTANVDHVYFRIIKAIDNIYDDNLRSILLSQPIVSQWEQDIDMRDDYKPQSTYIAVPPVEQGNYMLLASSEPLFDTGGIAMVKYSVSDIAIMADRNMGIDQCGFVVDRTTGRPVPGITVSMLGQKLYRGSYEKLTSVKTDKQGYYDFLPYIKSNYDKVKRFDVTKVEVNYKGHKVETNKWGGVVFDQDEDNQQNENFNLFFDRPVYKPGDSVHFAFIAYQSGYYEGKTLSGRKVSFSIRDENGSEIDSMTLFTDEYGLCSGAFVLAPDAMPGIWSIYSDCRFKREFFFQVEAYKQPKFTVKLSKPAVERRFGEEARINGIAASYTAVPLAGAKVKYSITRSLHHRSWHPLHRLVRPETVAHGELVTQHDGTFVIVFIPQPDSNIDLKQRPMFSYEIHASVTDINGETHDARTTLNVGFVNSYAEIESNESDADDVRVSVVCKNLDGNAIGGTAKVVVTRLQPPARPKLPCPAMRYQDSTIAMPLSKNEFEALFPLFDYDGTASDLQRWPVQKEVLSTTARTDGEKPYGYSFKGLPAGAYKIHAIIQSDAGDTVECVKYVMCQPSTSRQPVGSDLIVSSVDKVECEVGDKVSLRVGSRYDDVTLYVLVNKDKVSYRHELYKVSRGFTEITIPVDSSLQGGFMIEVCAIKCNHIKNDNFMISVPHVGKKLDVEFETFRNRLEPGNGEQWTLKIKDAKTGLPQAANLLMTMYDKALDAYGVNNFFINPCPSSYTGTAFKRIIHKVYSIFLFQPILPYQYEEEYDYQINMLKNVVDGLDVSTSLSMARLEDEEIANELFCFTTEEDEPMAASDVRAYKGGSRRSAVGMGDMAEEVVLADEGTSGIIAEEAEKVQMRHNLNTLAFFKPTLRSDTDGTVELSFSVPDLLTEWAIRGVAWTRDLKIGTLSASAITQKRLMVTPNVPRFLRHGDTCVFSVKVSNLSGKEQDIVVDFSFDLYGVSTLGGTRHYSDGGEGNNDARPQAAVQSARLTLKDGASGEVSFKTVAPREQVFLAGYKVVARGQGVSDGEQGLIPLLPGRQLVTESLAFYINGAGEKNYEMKHLTESVEGNASERYNPNQSSTSLYSLQLMVDVTPNPIWLALQCLPYVARQENPSNIYLANAVYANSLSKAIVENNPQIEEVFSDSSFAESEGLLSQLDRNSDLKQTVMTATPWLRDAQSEEQRHRDMARFFDKQAIAAQLSSQLSKLLAAQRADGGWSWIEGGSWSSPYVTQYILKNFGLLLQQGVELSSAAHRALKRAMNYVDSENYKYYKEYVKGTNFEPLNLDYLYVRSFFPDHRMSKQQQEAYDFFYSNAKKHCDSYRSLFSQAMLSVVFHRHGDTKLAHKMAARLREKALYSDEMGMYWRDNTSGWCWNERPIETQALLIRTFAEVLDDNESVARMQQWLLKQKQTTNWSSDVATVNAIQALLLGSSGSEGAPLSSGSLSVTFGNHTLHADTSRQQLHMSMSIQGKDIRPDDGRLTISKEDDGIAWGTMYWQYFEDVNKIPASSMGITLRRTLFRVETNGSLSLVTPDVVLHVGDKVRERIEISADRNMEYLELKIPRLAAFEPVSTASGWRWNDGLRFYCAITNTAMTFYVDRMDKGRYVAETEYYVNGAGTYATAPIVMQCLYAPEFRALCPVPAQKIEWLSPVGATYK